jgi:site-specific recombinase XerD
LHCHLLRHTFEVRFLTNGGNLMALRDVLGHSDISVTQIYLSMIPAHLQVQYKQYSPMDRIMAGR